MICSDRILEIANHRLEVRVSFSCLLREGQNYPNDMFKEIMRATQNRFNPFYQKAGVVASCLSSTFFSGMGLQNCQTAVPGTLFA